MPSVVAEEQEYVSHFKSESILPLSPGGTRWLLSVWVLKNVTCLEFAISDADCDFLDWRTDCLKYGQILGGERVNKRYLSTDFNSGVHDDE